MMRLVTTRLLAALLVMFGVSVLVFSLIHLVPGDPVEAMLGESARPADRESLRHSLGLDKALHIQLIDYLSGLAHLDLGYSIQSGRPVFDILLERIPATARLSVAALGVAIAIALPLGTLASIRPGGALDRFAVGLSSLGVAVPNFVTGPVLILIFSFALGWLPVSGTEGAGAIVLPAITLGTALSAVLTRMLRSSLLEVVSEDFIRTARAKGLRESVIMLRHALPNALLPVTTVLGMQLGVLLGGAVITEFVFSWPGLGQLTVEAIERRDYPVLQGCMLCISFSYVLINNLTDLVYVWLDPRVRLGA